MLPKNLLSDFEKLSISKNTIDISFETNTNNNSINTNQENRDSKEKSEIKKNRCTHDQCKKKVGLLGFDCKCGGYYCANHRHTDQHNCKSLQEIIKNERDILAKQNLKVVAEKLEKI